MKEIRRSIEGGYPVMNFPDKVDRLDLTDGYDTGKIDSFISSGGWAIGGYLEKRNHMYKAPQYENRRNIHMGVDIWAPANEPVFAPVRGRIVYKAYHDQPGNYGGTLVIRHVMGTESVYALYGHLSKSSVTDAVIGTEKDAGELVGRLGEWQENGNWPPHLHLELSVVDPGEADMPGVVSDDELEKAKEIYPDPKILIGDWYS
jgi:murein DD-endopeptidase MepM/ murein hydrolase activator NlpD